MKKVTGSTHSTPFWENGKFMVPHESQEWYATAWKWQWHFPIKIDKHKIKFVQEYEKEHGIITHWKDAEANMRPIVDGRDKGDLAYLEYKKKQEAIDAAA